MRFNCILARLLHWVVRILAGSDDSCFLAAWAVSKSALVTIHDRSKPILLKQKSMYLPIPMFSKDLLVGKCSF